MFLSCYLVQRHLKIGFPLGEGMRGRGRREEGGEERERRIKMGGDGNGKK